MGPGTGGVPDLGVTFDDGTGAQGGELPIESFAWSESNASSYAGSGPSSPSGKGAR